jgi:hypothetical protein
MKQKLDSQPNISQLLWKMKSKSHKIQSKTAQNLKKLLLKVLI